jgi:hypothetical protein
MNKQIKKLSLNMNKTQDLHEFKNSRDFSFKKVSELINDYICDFKNLFSNNFIRKNKE